ncbi:MAG TPA: YqzL family protein [Bacillales bacterium]
MLDFTWKVFCMTGNVDTYLLLKEMENGDTETGEALADGEPAAEFGLEENYHQPNELDL